MYIPVLWKDRVVQYPRRVSVTDLENGLKEWAPAPGEICQNGTPQSATNFGNQDFGILESDLLAAMSAIHLRLVQDSVDDLRGQILTTTLTNTWKYPATNSAKTITLPKMVNNTDYKVDIEVVEADGPVEYAEAYDKALNAFKVRYYGSAENVTLKLHVIGGLY